MAIPNASDLPIEQIETDKVSAENPFAKTRHGLAALALSTLMTTTSPASAQEAHSFEPYQVADAGPRAEGTISGSLDGLPMTAEEITVQAEMQRVASDVLRRRENGLEFYGPYLEEFSSLDLAGQYQIALLINAENSEGGPEYSQDTIDLVRNLRIPESMIKAILDEAIENGADPDPDWGDIQAFEKVLIELRESGVTQRGDTFTELVEFSPQNVSKIYFVYAVNTARGDLAVADSAVDDAQSDLAAADAAAVDAAAARRTREILEDALNAANGN